jgi:hypothetical protein
LFVLIEKKLASSSVASWGMVFEVKANLRRRRRRRGS